ncbi:MAG: triose-phosphate isomerase [Clostridia bacterium]|nr:triose-phosphate isomerase [Clostridia bacterium]MDD4375423.1 triose-phosphate isomerase [Clostridia bacterium]
MARKKVIVGNWKMNNTIKESLEFINNMKYKMDTNIVDVGICPQYLALSKIKEETKGTNIKIGAQNVHFADNGAYTGEVSTKMLEELELDYCIIGHSERRQYFNETDETVNKKLHKVLQTGMIPIVCVGEVLKEREENIHFEVVEKQVEAAFKDIEILEIQKCIIAYEPVWAIGTGKTATSVQAEEMCKYIREIIANLYSKEVAEKVRIQYGGSVNSGNAKEILNMPNIDGALVGGASLKVEFIEIIKAV